MELVRSNYKINDEVEDLDEMHQIEKGEKNIAQTYTDGRFSNRKYSSIEPTITEEEDHTPSANAQIRRSGSMSFGDGKKVGRMCTSPNDKAHEAFNFDTMFSTLSATKKAHIYQN